MKNLYCIFVFTFAMMSLNTDAAEEKKKEQRYGSDYYMQVREPFRVNVIKTAPSREDTAVIGLKMSCYNVGDQGSLDGLEIGLFSACGRLNGVQFGLFSCLCDHLEGLQVGFFHNYSKKFQGVQLGIVNRADSHAYGWQFGIVNFSKKDGIQFGLLNFKEDGFLPIFPLINF